MSDPLHEASTSSKSVHGRQRPTIADVELPVAPSAEHAAPLDSLGLESEYLGIMQELDGDAEGHERGDAYIAGTNALYHGGPIQWSFVPKIFSARDTRYLAWIAETMGGIMDKVTRAFAERPDVRVKFGLDPRIEGLALAPVAYATPIPIARVDIFLNEETGDFQFCELNTDGSSGMLSATEVTRANLLTETGRRFAARHDLSAFDIYAGCAEAVLGCYREVGGTAEHPVFAAVDYAESIVAEEIDEYARVFAEHGASLHFTDIRDLAYEDGVLRDAQGPIDGVWRRVVISEMLEKPCPGADAFMRCVHDGRVPVMGGFRTWPCATKTVFAVLHDPVCEEILTPEELAYVRAHVPATYLVDEGSDLSRFHEKDRWIAKPREGYNSVGVRAGSDCTDAEWAEVLAEMARTHGTVQAYAPQFATPNVEGGVAGIGRSPVGYSNMEGLFLFNGKFGGVFTRCGTSAVIGEFAGRLNMGCLVSRA